MHETEIKLRTDDFDGVRERLNSLGARLKERVEDETDLIFDSPNDPLLLQGRVLRLRLTVDSGMLTWKGEPTFTAGVKKREEIQTVVSNAREMRAVLERLGFAVGLEFSKSREYWDLSGLAISLDELPFGRYVEVEGDESLLEGAVRDLGLEDAERVTEGYPQLAARHLGAAPRP